MNSGKRWIPRFAPGHAAQVLDIPEEHGFVREPTMGSYDEPDVVDAIETCGGCRIAGCSTRAACYCPDSRTLVASRSDRPRPLAKRAALQRCQALRFASLSES
jgi:hypothetical protein